MKNFVKIIKKHNKSFHLKHFIGNEIKAVNQVMKSQNNNQNEIIPASLDEIDETVKLSNKAFLEYKKINDVTPFLESIKKNIKKREKEIIQTGISYYF
jgi:hypothetical protein